MSASYQGPGTLVLSDGQRFEGVAKWVAWRDPVLWTWRGYFVPDDHFPLDQMGEEITLELPGGVSGQVLIVQMSSGRPMALQGTGPYPGQEYEA